MSSLFLLLAGPDSGTSRSRVWVERKTSLWIELWEVHLPENRGLILWGHLFHNKGEIQARLFLDLVLK